LQLAVIDQVIVNLTEKGQSLSQATWGARNTAAIAHPMSAAIPFLDIFLSAPKDQLAGDNNMPRVAGKNFGQSERLVVSPGHENEGVLSMPGGQSGHPLSPFFWQGIRHGSAVKQVRCYQVQLCILCIWFRANKLNFKRNQNLK